MRSGATSAPRNHHHSNTGALMSDAQNPYQSWGMLAAEAPAETRADFISKTYLHLAGAIAAFVGLEVLLFASGVAEPLVNTMLGGRFSWLIVLGAFIAVSYIAQSWAQSAVSLSKQYAGLALYVVAEAIIFVPLLYIAKNFGVPGVIGSAALLTLVLFGGLTAIVFITRNDFSFLRSFLMFGGFAALGIIVVGLLMGFPFGMWFIAPMILLACGYILYDTSNVLHHYRTDQYVAASLALFAAVALLFWYILQMVMSLTSRD
jgi:FtsH-binding integral membrane protein